MANLPRGRPVQRRASWASFPPGRDRVKRKQPSRSKPPQRADPTGRLAESHGGAGSSPPHAVAGKRRVCSGKKQCCWKVEKGEGKHEARAP